MNGKGQLCASDRPFRPCTTYIASNELSRLSPLLHLFKAVTQGMVAALGVATSGVVHVAEAHVLRPFTRRLHPRPDDGEGRAPGQAVVGADGPSSGVVGLVHRPQPHAEPLSEIDHVDWFVHTVPPFRGLPEGSRGPAAIVFCWGGLTARPAPPSEACSRPPLSCFCSVFRPIYRCPLPAVISLFPVYPMRCRGACRASTLCSPLVLSGCRDTQEGWGYLSMNLRLLYHNNRASQEKSLAKVKIFLFQRLQQLAS